jgi:hypothetical protein
MKARFLFSLFITVFAVYGHAKLTVQKLVTPAGENSSFSRVFTDNKSNVYLSWVKHNPDKTIATLFFAQLDKDGQHWQTPIQVASGANWFNNWADFPSVVIKNNNITGHFLQKSASGTYDYDVKLTMSSDNGKNWLTPFTAHNDGVEAEHGFVSMMPQANGNTFVSWLDGRNSKETASSNEHGHAGSMTLRAGIFSSTGSAVNRWQLDHRVCDCCQTSAALTSNGPVVVYRNRSTHEVRDIFITRLVDDIWTDPVPVHIDGWKISGCPVNGPVVMAKDQDVAVAWFTGKDQLHQVKLATSIDGGATFSSPIIITKEHALGRVGMTLLPNKDIVVSWVKSAQENSELILSRYSSKGVLLSNTRVTSLSKSRRSGFPVITSVKNRVFVSWTNIEQGQKVELAQVDYHY